MPVYDAEVCAHAFNKHVEEATDRLVKQLSDIGLRRVVQRLAKEHMMSSISVFGDTSWEKLPDALMVEILEELADAVVYSVMRMNASSGGPGSKWGRHE